jgi:hypothetical protein
VLLFHRTGSSCTASEDCKTYSSADGRVSIALSGPGGSLNLYNLSTR